MVEILEAAAAPARDRHIAQPVHPANFWRDWLHAADRVASVALGELLAGAARLLVVAPHPDDELLMCAGLMQAALAQGVSLTIVSVTDGEACFGNDAERARVGAMRRAEARAGLQVLGAGSAPLHRMALPDGGVTAHEAEVRHLLQLELQPGDLVVAPWRLDGHPDHDAVGRAAAAACSSSRARLLEAPVWMWHWATPEHPAIRWQRLRTCAMPAKAGARKRDALACHRSQLTRRNGREPVVDSALQARSGWSFESFFLS